MIFLGSEVLWEDFGPSYSDLPHMQTHVLKKKKEKFYNIYLNLQVERKKKNIILPLFSTLCFMKLINLRLTGGVMTIFNKEVLYSIQLLLHHVIPGSFKVDSLQDEMTGVSLAGTQLRVNTYVTQDTEWNDIKVSYKLSTRTFQLCQLL